MDKENKEPSKPSMNTRNLLIAGGVVVGVIVVFMAGVALDHASLRRQRGELLGQRFGTGIMHRGGRMGRQGVKNNENRLRGVVTGVNGDSFTLAGNGATNTVTTNSSTQYTNGSKVAVNDTVLVVGTTNNGTFTASRIVINP